MTRLVEATVFLSLAGALHLAALTLPPVSGSGPAGGDGGTSGVTLQAAPETLAALARQWDAPPTVSNAPDLPAPDVDPTPNAALADNSPQRIKLPAAPLMGVQQDPLPRRDTRLPAPPGLSSADVAPLRPPAPLMPLAAPSRDDAPVRSAAPLRPDQQPPAPPQIDTAPAEPRFAPTASLRPQVRPERQNTPSKSRPAAAPQQAQAQQRTKGTGTGTASQQRSAEPAAAAGPSRATLRAAQADWGGRIRQAVARAQRYPRGTSAQGVVKLQITVAPSGRLSGARIVASSGNAALDRAALSAAKSARLPRAPNVLRAASYNFNLPLKFARR